MVFFLLVFFQALNQLKKVSLLLVVLFLFVKAFTLAVEVLNALYTKSIIHIDCEDLLLYDARISLVRVIRNGVNYCYWSLKFFLYFASCASFRRRFCSILRKICRCCRSKKKEEEEKEKKENAEATVTAATSTTAVMSITTQPTTMSKSGGKMSKDNAANRKLQCTSDKSGSDRQKCDNEEHKTTIV
jgi:hypothetical protein